jgi:hypothetical protein
MKYLLYHVLYEFAIAVILLSLLQFCTYIYENSPLLPPQGEIVDGRGGAWRGNIKKRRE